MKNRLIVLLKIGIVVLSFFFSVRAKEASPFARIPFELKSGYLVFSVPIEPSGSLSLLFDTGCQTTTIGQDVLDIGSRGQAITLLLGTRELIIDDYHVRPSAALSKALDQKIDGVIGNDILHNFTVQIDFKNKMLSLFNSEEFVTYPNGDVVAIEVNSLVSSVPLTIIFPEGQQVDGDFMIDTGAPVNVVINSPVAEKYGLHTNLELSREREFKTLADVQTAAAAIAGSVRIGSFECADMEIFVSTSKRGLFAGSRYAGIVGNKFFQNFDVIFDYKRKTLHIKKS